jgi:hypothetical protein
MARVTSCSSKGGCIKSAVCGATTCGKGRRESTCGRGTRGSLVSEGCGTQRCMSGTTEPSDGGPIWQHTCNHARRIISEWDLLAAAEQWHFSCAACQLMLLQWHAISSVPVKMLDSCAPELTLSSLNPSTYYMSTCIYCPTCVPSNPACVPLKRARKSATIFPWGLHSKCSECKLRSRERLLMIYPEGWDLHKKGNLQDGI